MSGMKTCKRWLVGIGFICLTSMRLSGCGAFSQQFRSAATPSLRTGVNAILDGFVQGIFAVVDPNAPNSNSNSASNNSTGNNSTGG